MSEKRCHKQPNKQLSFPSYCYYYEAEYRLPIPVVLVVVVVVVVVVAGLYYYPAQHDYSGGRTYTYIVEVE